MDPNITYHAPFKHFVVENFEHPFGQSEKGFRNETISFKSNEQSKEEGSRNETISFITFRNSEINEQIIEMNDNISMISSYHDFNELKHK